MNFLATSILLDYSRKVWRTIAGSGRSARHTRRVPRKFTSRNEVLAVHHACRARGEISFSKRKS